MQCADWHRRYGGNIADEAWEAPAFNNTVLQFTTITDRNVSLGVEDL
jgi:hypothetical protein